MMLSQQTIWTASAIEAVAHAHRVCPFELSLELSRWADCIIGDYNYAFDPRVYLKRFFDEENGAYAFLVDEAHNLVDRSREMFSAKLSKSPNSSNSGGQSKQHTCQTFFGRLERSTPGCSMPGKGFWDRRFSIRCARLPDGLEPLLRTFLRVSERWLAMNQADALSGIPSWSAISRPADFCGCGIGLTTVM
jgi:DNA excision repair protein ERCC-2